MKDEYHLIGRLIGEAVVASWIGDRGIADVSGFDFRVAEKHFLAALRANGLEVVSVEPTPQMCQAYYDLCRKEETLAVAASDIWRTMITAATPTAGK